MFINDTGRLPDSGRVCVMGFQSGSSGAKRYYSLQIEAARVEVAPLPEPRNAHHVLGVGAEIQSLKGPVFAAYFAATRDRYDAEPNYKSGLFVLVDGAVYAVKAEDVGITIRRRFSTREFTLMRGDRPQRTVQYSWPWYREPFMSAAPGHVRSADFMHEMEAMVRAYS